MIADDHAGYFGVELSDESLVPGDNPRVGTIHFETWLNQQPRKAA